MGRPTRFGSIGVSEPPVLMEKMKMKQKKLTAKQEAFCREYVIDHNAAQAYIRAGYSPRGANKLAARLMANHGIKARIAELEAPIIEKQGIEAEDVIAYLCRLAQTDITEAIPDEGWLTLADIKQLPKELRMMIRGWKHTQHGLEIKWADPDKAWDMLAKHFGLLKDKFEFEVTVGLADRIAAARQRVKAMSDQDGEDAE